MDDYSRKKWVYGLKNKEGATVITAFKDFLSKHPQSVQILRTDNGSEFTNHDFIQLMSANRITRELTPPYSPQFNGVVESAIAELRSAAITILSHAQLFGKNRALWFEAVRFACDKLNNWPCSSNPNNKSPNQMLGLSTDSVSPHDNLIFGSKVYVHINDVIDKSHLGNKSYLGIYMGRSSPIIQMMFFVFLTLQLGVLLTLVM